MTRVLLIDDDVELGDMLREYQEQEGFEATAVHDGETGAATTVEMDVRRSPSGNAALVSVADRGPGVASAELKTIFGPFYRGGAGQVGAAFGLGLAIARRAVEAHGGRVRAHNREGGGLVIEMSLPLAEE